MRFYPHIIVISTLATLSHFLFRESSATVEWLVYNLSQSLFGCSTLLAFAMFISVPYSKIGLKLFTGVYFFLSLISPVYWMLNGNHHSLVIPIMILVSAGAYWLFKAPSWNVNIKGDQLLNTGIFIVFKRPSGFYPWLGSLFGIGIGSCYLVVNGNQYHISRYSGEFRKAPLEMVGDVCFKLDIATHLEDSFEVDLGGLIGEKFNPVSKNCLSILRKPLGKYGINVGTILPSRYIKEFIK